ncbi:jg18605 [Pararge aegeria aegeria]|uniref:Jg18605 protein n=1 Tax=Pararge aegeria aegeria TaxID=348720 RepID=A0A8S4R5K1_9NEOP|nr:jg18605 [Pararge aegeria aegeria]
MSVVFSQSTRNMTHTNLLLVLVVTISLLESIAGASFSNVVVQRDGIVPLGYINYDPISFGNSQAAQLSMAPLDSVVQVPSVSAIVSPCLAPCIIPKPASQGLAPISTTSNAKIITYQPAVPNVPVVTTNQEAARGYQYAYAVYDDQTGDKKSQSEQSDGSVVKGQYSFIQPDGLRREVDYTADDLKGFNAVVRNISPEQAKSKENELEVVKPKPAPCPEPVNAQLTQNREQSLEGVTSEVDNLEEQTREPKSKPKSVQESVENSVERSEGKVNTPEGKAEKKKPREEEPHQNSEPIDNSPVLLDNVVSYYDIIKCLQTKLINANSAVSPLTYILIPSLQGPC